MNKLYGIAYVMDMLKVLADHPYSALWTLVEDFTFNGHFVSVKNSTWLRHIIIDNVYHSISEDVTIVSDGKNYSALEYVQELLLKEVE